MRGEQRCKGQKARRTGWNHKNMCQWGSKNVCSFVRGCSLCGSQLTPTQNSPPRNVSFSVVEVNLVSLAPIGAEIESFSSFFYPEFDRELFARTMRMIFELD